MGFGTMRSGSNSSRPPRPSQVGQAPWGLLKEKVLGRDLGIADAVDDAGELLAVEQVLFLIHEVHEHDAVGLMEGGLD